MCIIALVSACAICISHGRRVRIESEQLQSTPSRQSSLLADVPKSGLSAELMLALENPAAAWQAIGHGQQLANRKLNGKSVGLHPQVRMSAEEATQRRFAYQPKPRSANSYRADSGFRPQRRDNYDPPTRPNHVADLDADDMDEGYDEEDDMDEGYGQRRSGGGSYRADGYRSPQRRDESDFGNGRYRPRQRDNRVGYPAGRGGRSARRERDAPEGSASDDVGDLEAAFEGEYIYGVSPVLAALKAQRREFNKLYLQNNVDVGKRKDMSALREIVRLAGLLDLEIEERDKHHLNTLCNHRPHQGLVLEAEPLERRPMQLLPEVKEGEAPLWLALDEITDPMNFGSLLRTAFFLGVDGVVMSKKNCAPLTPVVSKTSVGAMEIMKVHEVKNLPKTLQLARENGWQIVGTALENAVHHSEVNHTAPTVLVLGNEGHGIRAMVKNVCSKMVRIPRGPCGKNLLASLGDEQLVDSLNVGVAGGVLLHSLLADRGRFDGDSSQNEQSE